MIATIIGAIGGMILLVSWYRALAEPDRGDPSQYFVTASLGAIGAALLGVETFSAGAWSAFTLNVLWVIISLYAVMQWGRAVYYQKKVFKQLERRLREHV